MPQSGGFYRARNGNWERYSYHELPALGPEEGRGMVAEPAPEKPADIRYPTLAEISAHIRRGTDCTHGQLVDVMEQMLRQPAYGLTTCA